MSDVMLSIYVATYNHEKYIAQALESILMQKTKYSYEVLVGEDSSTDNTRAVLKEYEKKYPSKIHVFYREHNMWNEFPNNGMDLRNRCCGKYIIALEGDDYWIDPKKLDKQIDFLEENPEYIGVAHKCIVVDENSCKKDEKYPECEQEEYTFRHFCSEIMPGQLTTVMYKNPNRMKKECDTSIMQKKMSPGDRATYFWLLINGNVYCMKEIMSAYRHITDHGSSYSATCSYKFKEADNLYRSLLEYAKANKNREAEKYAEFLYFRNLLQGMRRKQCSVSDFRRGMINVEHKIVSVGLYCKYRFYKNILHKRVCL